MAPEFKHLSIPLISSLCALGSLTAADVPADQPGAATNPKAAVPKGPLLSRIPEFASWSVTYTYSDPQDAPQKTPGQENKPPEPETSAAVARPKRVLFTKTRNILHVETVDERRQTWNRWCRDALQIVVFPAGKGMASCEGQDIYNPFYEDYQGTTFPGFEWVSPATFAGIENVHSRDCMVFRSAVKRLDLMNPGEAAKLRALADEGTPIPEEALKTQQTVALVDLETRLPVALQVAGEVRRYTFLAQPSAMLEFPDRVQALFTERDAAWQRVTRPLLSP
jgi:hypothetical protein